MGEHYYIYRDGQKFRGPLTEEQAHTLLQEIADRAFRETGMGSLFDATFLEFRGRRIAHVWEIMLEGEKSEGGKLREFLNYLYERMEEVWDAEGYG